MLFKKGLRISIFVLTLMFLLNLSVYADNVEIAEVEEVENIIHTLEYKTGEDVVEGFYNGETLTYAKDSPEMAALLQSIKESVVEDAKVGLDKLKTTVPTRDNIELKQWGLFLYKYTDKEITEFPIGDIEFAVGKESFKIKESKASKSWVKEDVLPIIYNAIVSESINYPAAMYKLDITAGAKLVDIVVDIEDSNNFVELYKVYPLTGKNENTPTNFIVYNTGVYYGLTLNSDYVQVLKGYHNELDYLKQVEKDIPACVNILAYITFPKNLSGFTMDGKLLRDMSIYEGLAVNLLTKKLIDTNNLTTDSVEVLYKDYSLKEEQLILLSLEDSIVVVQPIFVECIERWGWDLNTAYTMDLTQFLIGQSDTISLTNISDGTQKTSKIQDYVFDDGYVLMKFGSRYPFLLYTREDSTPYDRILKRLYSSEGSNIMDKEQLKVVTDTIEKEMKAQNRDAELKQYLKEAGKTSFPIIAVLVVVFVLIVITTLIILISRSKNKNKNDLLFDPEEEDNE